jgi:hypothetical protein
LKKIDKYIIIDSINKTHNQGDNMKLTKSEIEVIATEAENEILRLVANKIKDAGGKLLHVLGSQVNALYEEQYNLNERRAKTESKVNDLLFKCKNAVFGKSSRTIWYISMDNTGEITVHSVNLRDFIINDLILHNDDTTDLSTERMVQTVERMVNKFMPGVTEE